MTTPGLSHSLTRWFYRRYRRLKGAALSRPDSWKARLLTRPMEWARGFLGQPVPTVQDQARQAIWKTLYFHKYGQSSPFGIESARDVALDSDDYKWPRGAVYDNSVNRNFNLKLYSFFRNKADLHVLDLGCAGGAFVKTFHEDGYTAVGIDGSDAPRKLRSAEWDTIPHHLFTADISKPFTLREVATNETAQFDCVTAWEVLEHIPEERLPDLFDNIARHMAPGGIFVGSVAVFPEANLATGAVYHVCIHERDWWLGRFGRAGLVSLDDHPFETRDFVRGHGMGLKDWDPNDGDGFHVVLRKSATAEEGNRLT